MTTFDTLSEVEAFEQACEVSPINNDSLDGLDLPQLTDNPYHEFRMERYCWDGVDLREYGIIPLTRGYFVVVSPEDYDKAAQQAWTANVQKCRETGRIVKIYAVRSSTAKEQKRGAPQFVYLHREFTGSIYVGRKLVVDHRNGLSLDCRQINLQRVDQGLNLVNKADDKVTKRTKHHGVPRGVEPVKRSYGTAYRATVHVRGKRVRAKTVFTCPERAGRWFRRMNAILHPKACLANNNVGLPAPIAFPPVADIYADVPF